jgi:HK97 family phage major capsid protein
MNEEEIKAIATKAAAETKKAIEKATEDVNSEVKALKTELEAQKQKSIDTEKVLGETKSQLDALEIKQKDEVIVKSFAEQLQAAIAEKHEEIKDAFKSRTNIEIELKAVGDITTASGLNLSVPDIVGSQIAPISNVNLREIGVLGLTTNMATSQAAYAYTEAVPKEGDYAFLNEGAVKPQIDFKWETNYAKPVKVAAWLRLTDESIQDVVGLQSVATDFLFKKHNLKKSRGILFGNGVLPNPKGATLFGRAFVAGGMALKVVTPNFMDIVNAAVTDIAVTHNYEDEIPYQANVVMINPVDHYINICSAKDANGLPLYPQAGLNSTVTIGGMTIIPEESIPLGKMFVADMSKYNTTNYIGYTVKIGYVNDDFIKNQFVILGESRFHAFVKKLDVQAFIYDDIATIKAAITKP